MKKEGYILCTIVNVCDLWVDAKCCRTGRELTFLFLKNGKNMAWLKQLIGNGRMIGIKAKKTEDDGIYIYRGASTKLGYVQKARARREKAEGEFDALAREGYNPVRGKHSSVGKSIPMDRLDGKGKVATMLRASVKQDNAAEKKFLDELKKHGL